jgi:hypothetical protein
MQYFLFNVVVIYIYIYIHNYKDISTFFGCCCRSESTRLEDSNMAVVALPLLRQTYNTNISRDASRSASNVDLLASMPANVLGDEVGRPRAKSSKATRPLSEQLPVIIEEEDPMMRSDFKRRRSSDGGASAGPNLNIPLLSTSIAAHIGPVPIEAVTSGNYVPFIDFAPQVRSLALSLSLSLSLSLFNRLLSVVFIPFYLLISLFILFYLFLLLKFNFSTFGCLAPWSVSLS